MNEKKFIEKKTIWIKNYPYVLKEDALMASKIARLRGLIKAYNDDGCMGSSSNCEMQLKSLLKNRNYK